MTNNCMNCGAMLLKGAAICPVCRQPIQPASGASDWQQQPQGQPWQPPVNRPPAMPPPPPLAAPSSSGVGLAVGIIVVLVLALGGVIGLVTYLNTQRERYVRDYNRNSPVQFTPSPADSQTPINSSNTNRRARKNSEAPISGGVLNAKATSLPEPAYPATAKAVNASGIVVVQVTVDESGKVTEATAISGHPLLRAAAVAAARQAQFRPTTLSGRPVKVTGILTYNFTPE